MGGGAVRVEMRMKRARDNRSWGREGLNEVDERVLGRERVSLDGRKRMQTEGRTSPISSGKVASGSRIGSWIPLYSIFESNQWVSFGRPDGTAGVVALSPPGIS